MWMNKKQRRQVEFLAEETSARSSSAAIAGANVSLAIGVLRFDPRRAAGPTVS